MAVCDYCANYQQKIEKEKNRGSRIIRLPSAGSCAPRRSSSSVRTGFSSPYPLKTPKANFR